MDFEGIIIGMVFIILGFLVKAFPNLMVGYNTMSPEQKMNVDEPGLIVWARNCLVFIGLLLIIGTFVFSVLDIDSFAMPYLMSIIVAGILVLIYGAQRFNRN